MYITAIAISVCFLIYSVYRRKLDDFFARRYFYLLLLLVVFLSLFIFSIVLKDNEELGVDEMEHIHSAWYIAQGDRPYTDFFEHHNPLFWFLITPFFYLFGYTLKIIIVLKIAMFLLTLGSAFTVYLIGKKVSDSKETKFLAVIILFSIPMFVECSTDIRPDTPQVLFGLISVYYLLDFFQTKRKKSIILAGFNASISFLFLQKTLFLLIAYAIIFLFELFKKKMRWFSVFCFAISFSLPQIVFLGYLLKNGILKDYFFTNWIFNMYRPNPFSPFETLKPFHRKASFWLFAGISLIYILKQKKMNKESKILTFIGTILIISLFLVNYPWPQYFMFPISILSISIAQFLSSTFNKIEWHAIYRLAFLCLVMVFPMLHTMQEKFCEKSHYQWDMMDFVLQNTLESDFVYDAMNEGRPVFNIYRKDLHYFWFYVHNNREGLKTYNRITGNNLKYDIYSLIETKKPKFISNYDLDMDKNGLRERYRKTKYELLYIRKEKESNNAK